MLRDKLSLVFIKWAAKLTSWGDTHDRLLIAQSGQECWISYLKGSGQ